MEERKISGMTMDEYREWLKPDIKDFMLKNGNESIDDLISSKPDIKLRANSFNSDDYTDDHKGKSLNDYLQDDPSLTEKHSYEDFITKPISNNTNLPTKEMYAKYREIISSFEQD